MEPSRSGLLERLQKINDEVFLLPGVDRAAMKSFGLRQPAGQQ